MARQANLTAGASPSPMPHRRTPVLRPCAFPTAAGGARMGSCRTRSLRTVPVEEGVARQWIEKVPRRVPSGLAVAPEGMWARRGRRRGENVAAARRSLAGISHQGP